MYLEHVEATPEERQAVVLRFRKQNPNAPPDAQPTPEEEERLLLEIRERVDAIEGEALKMLLRATRNPPTRSGMWSKHMQFISLNVLFPMFLLGLFAALIMWLATIVFS